MKLGDAAGGCFQEVMSWPSWKEAREGDWPGAPSPLQGYSVEDDEGRGLWSLVGRSQGCNETLKVEGKGAWETRRTLFSGASQTSWRSRGPPKEPKGGCISCRSPSPLVLMLCFPCSARHSAKLFLCISLIRGGFII